MAPSIDIDIDNIHDLMKSQLKKLIKERISDKMMRMVDKAKSM